jgi:hypothetical protein
MAICSVLALGRPSNGRAKKRGLLEMRLIEEMIRISETQH